MDWSFADFYSETPVTITVAAATMKTAQVPGPGAEFQIVEREISWGIRADHYGCRSHAELT
jgi:hypothetical protein